jgi:ATP-dependent RNA circularization protein (DNA/RNA ligase family)
MIKYPKINSIFKRDDHGRFTTEYSCPEFEYLKDNPWCGTEKIDGTNIRIGYKNGEYEIGGRTDKAQVPPHLYEHLQNIIDDKFRDHIIFDTDAEIVLFGEGYGHKIQGNPYKCDVSFMLFDIWVNGWWIKQEDVVSIANDLCIDTIKVSMKYFDNLNKAIEYVKTPFPSELGICNAEGLVLEPMIPLHNRKGDRIITKIKTKDFR